MPQDAPITKANVLAGMVESIVEIGHELEAWRRFGQDVAAYLKDRGEQEQFNAWRDEQQAEQTKKQRRARR